MVVTLLALVGFVAIPAGTASAHTVSGVGPNNYRTDLVSVLPAVPGLTVRVIEAGSRLELTNHTGADVTVIGYQDEPYLRVGPAGVFVNTRSPATYVNGSRTGKGTHVPADADPTAAPVWKRVGSGLVARWHDHRIHWLLPKPPAEVRAHPGRPLLINSWSLVVKAGTTPVTLSGTLRWVPGPSPLPWIVGALVLAAAVAGLLYVLRRSRLALIGLVVLLIVDLRHQFGIGFTRHDTLSRQITTTLAASPTVLWVVTLGVLGWATLRRRPDRLVLAAVAVLAAVFALVGGAGEWTTLARSTVPFVGGAWVARLLTALTIGLGVGLAVGGGLGVLRLARPAVAGVDDEAGGEKDRLL